VQVDGPLGGITVRLGGKRATTDGEGRARLRVRFFHPGLKTASASLPSRYRKTKKTIRVLP
jgi:hypothetical protein